MSGLATLPGVEDATLPALYGAARQSARIDKEKGRLTRLSGTNAFRSEDLLLGIGKLLNLDFGQVLADGAV